MCFSGPCLVSGYSVCRWTVPCEWLQCVSVDCLMSGYSMCVSGLCLVSGYCVFLSRLTAVNCLTTFQGGDVAHFVGRGTGTPLDAGSNPPCGKRIFSQSQLSL